MSTARFEANYEAEVQALQTIFMLVLEQSGFPQELAFARYSEFWINNIAQPTLDRNVLMHYPERVIGDPHGGYAVFTCDIIPLPASTSGDGANSVNVAHVIAYTRFEEYEHLVWNLQKTLNSTFTQVIPGAIATPIESPEVTAPNNSMENREETGEYPISKDKDNKLWMKIPDRNWHRRAAMLWWQGNTSKQIAAVIHISSKAIDNIFSEYRQDPEYGPTIIPTAAEMKRLNIR